MPLALGSTDEKGADDRVGFVEFVEDRWSVLSFLAYQHMSLVVQTLFWATVCALVVGVLLYRSRWGQAVGDSLTSIGLTIPSYALLGVLVGIVGIGVWPSVIMLIFSGIARGGANATNSVVAGTVGILILAVILDTVLNAITRLTTRDCCRSVRTVFTRRRWGSLARTIVVARRLRVQ